MSIKREREKSQHSFKPRHYTRYTSNLGWAISSWKLVKENNYLENRVRLGSKCLQVIQIAESSIGDNACAPGARRDEGSSSGNGGSKNSELHGFLNVFSWQNVGLSCRCHNLKRSWVQERYDWKGSWPRSQRYVAVSLYSSGSSHLRVIMRLTSLDFFFVPLAQACWACFPSRSCIETPTIVLLYFIVQYQSFSFMYTTKRERSYHIGLGNKYCAAKLLGCSPLTWKCCLYETL